MSYGGILAILICTYVIGLAAFRLFLHPLRAFPGPRLAALTVWYKFYYDVIKQGSLLGHMAKLHEKYGVPWSFIPSEIIS